tara:strand:+ start:134 stop:397 length:264 start_codon:yes stop_codon:yes gene_type:complete
MPTKTIPNGGKSTKFSIIVDKNHHIPSEDSKFLAIIFLPVGSNMEYSILETIADRRNTISVPIKNRNDGSGSLLPDFSIKDSILIIF